MSGTADLTLREQIVRIDRSIAETEKLQAETREFTAEQLKLAAEAAKLDRERWWRPALAIAGLITAGGALWHALHGG